MNWFKGKINRFLKKKASRMELTNQALQKLQDRVYTPRDITVEFMNLLDIEEPGFMDGAEAKALISASYDYDVLINAFNNLSKEDTVKPYIPALPTETETTFEEDVPTEDEKIKDEEIKDEEEDEEEDEEADVDTTDDSAEDVVAEPITKQLDTLPELGTTVSADPTILETYKVPVQTSAAILSKFANLNKKLRAMYYPEIKVEFIKDEEGKTKISNERIAVQGEWKDIDFVEVSISGTLPSPSEEINVNEYGPLFTSKGKPRRNRDGTPKEGYLGVAPKGVKLIGQIIPHIIPKKTVDEYTKLPEGSPLRTYIQNALAKGEVPHSNQINALGDDKIEIESGFWSMPSNICRGCKRNTKRKVTYVGVVVEPNQMKNKTEMKTENGVTREVTVTRLVDVNRGKKDKKGKKKEPKWEPQPVRYIPDEALEGGHQYQFGGTCINPFDGMTSINNIQEYMEKLQNAENLFREKAAKPSKGAPKKMIERGKQSTDALFAVAVRMMREDADMLNDMEKDPKKILDFAFKTRAYERSLDPKYNKKFNQSIERNLPTITDYDKQLASDVRRWWGDRVGDWDLESGDQNKITLSILPTMPTTNRAYYNHRQKPKVNLTERKNLANIFEMIETYLGNNNVVLDRASIEEERQRKEEEEAAKRRLQEEEMEARRRGREEEDAYSDNEAFNARKIQEREEEARKEEERKRQEAIPVKPIRKITDIAKSVLQNGVTRDGRPITPEKLIPLYVKGLAKHVPTINLQTWENAFRRSLEQRGVDALIGYIESIPKHFKEE
jgi:hypothetical protein